MPLLSRLTALRDFFDTGVTKDFTFRMQQLEKLQDVLILYEDRIYNALYEDLKKSPEESWVTEVGILMAEINYARKNLHEWMKPKKVKTNLINQPSKSFILTEPKGVVLIIGPWNYPVQLLLNPLVGAIAAGNCVVLKSSEHAPASTALMKEMIETHFGQNYILFTEGEGAVTVPEMMKNFVFDHVFFTGSTTVGRSVYKMAAENLVPVTLELGGKSPCIVEKDAHLKVAAKRIVVTKFSNAGQMCVAPDYLLVHESVKDAFIIELIKQIKNFYGEDPSGCPHYGKIINEKQFERITSYFSLGNIIHGGSVNRDKLYIEPTLITNVKMNSPVMQDEIFGPVLPILTFSNREEVLNILSENKNPLAFYVFTSNKEQEQFWLQSVAFGGGCVNNTGWHLTNHHLPFGGRGWSGSGQYHGKFSFDTFSHKKSILKTPVWFDPSIKYPPFKGKLKLFKWVLR